MTCSSQQLVMMATAGIMTGIMAAGSTKTAHQELEDNHKAGHSSCELLIEGCVYIIDLTNMIQSHRNDCTRKYRVKCHLFNLTGCKGVAGLKIIKHEMLNSDRPGDEGRENTKRQGRSFRQSIPIQQGDESSKNHQSLSPPMHNNTPQKQMTPSESLPHSTTKESDLSVHLERL